MRGRVDGVGSYGDGHSDPRALGVPRRASEPRGCPLLIEQGQGSVEDHKPHDGATGGRACAGWSRQLAGREVPGAGNMPALRSPSIALYLAGGVMHFSLPGTDLVSPPFQGGKGIGGPGAQDWRALSLRPNNI